MSAYGDNPGLHHIKDERFVCTAPEDAPCRTVPTCECENWCCCDGSPEDAADNHDLGDGEHCCMQTTEPGHECWMVPWVDAVGIEDSCTAFTNGMSDPRLPDADGDLTVWPDGPVTCEWDDGVWWEYAEREATS